MSSFTHSPCVGPSSRVFYPCLVQLSLVNVSHHLLTFALLLSMLSFYFFRISLTLTDHTVALGFRMQLPYLLARP